MGLGGILRELQIEGVLALYHDYRFGHLLDLSGNGNNGSPSGTIIFTKTGVKLQGAATAITVLHSASLVFTSCSLIISRSIASFDTGYQYERFMGKRGLAGGNVHFEWYNNNSPTSVAISSATAATISSLPNIIGKRTDAISVNSGSTSYYYINGVSYGALAGVCTVNSYAETLFIGNTNTGYATINRNNPIINYALIITRALTAGEHARLYYDLARVR